MSIYQLIPSPLTGMVSENQLTIVNLSSGIQTLSCMLPQEQPMKPDPGLPCSHCRSCSRSDAEMRSYLQLLGTNLGAALSAYYSQSVSALRECRV